MRDIELISLLLDQVYMPPDKEMSISPLVEIKSEKSYMTREK
jgi:hypothetical protein